MGSRIYPSPPTFIRPERDTRYFHRRGDLYQDHFAPLYRGFIDPLSSLNLGRDYGIGIEPRGRGLRRRVLPNLADRRPPSYGFVDEYDDLSRCADAPPARERRRSSQLPPVNVNDPDPPAPAEKSTVPFSKAMRNLHRQLDKTASTYETFQRDYENDISSIKKYATKDILDRLWKLRVKGEKDPKTIGDNDDENEQPDEELAGNKDKLQLCQRNAAQALKVAINSAVKEKGSKSRIRTAEHLKDKVKTSSRQILKLFDLALEGPEHCVTLWDELDELKKMVDPESPRNKALYKGDLDEDAVSSGGSGGGSDDGLRDNWD